jgi:hypothetical protein
MMTKKAMADRFRAFDFAKCPFCGSPYQPDDIIYHILSELCVCRLIECRRCHTVYCVQRREKPRSRVKAKHKEYI